MNASAIYSKSGKGVQEASGKTSHLSRPDRAVLSAIDGRATLADVAQKVGKTFDAAFEKLIESLDKGGFIREVSAGTPGSAPKPGGPAAKPAAKPAGPVDPASDLDFTTIMSSPRSAPPPQSPPKAAPPPPRQTATIPPPPPPPSAADKAKADQVAKQQQDAMARAREEAEKKAQAERDRVKAEAEAKMRAETEAKLRAEAEAKAKADAEAKLAAEAEAKVKAAREAAVKAAAEAKARADAEAKKAREEAERARREAEEKAEQARKEAERARKEAEEKAERIRKEAEEKARREQEELRRKLEEERKAREEAERKAKEEARRIEEERRKLEEERKAREEERRREEAEREARRKAEEEEEKERKRKKREAEEEEERREAEEKAERKRREQEEEERREAEERAEREAKRRAKQQEEEEEAERERAEKEARRRAKEEEKARAKEEEKARAKEKEKEPEPAAAKPAGGGGFSDTLLADLESFTTRDEQEQKEREEAERKEKELAAQRAREAEERRQREEAERLEREEKERRKREAAEQKAREEAELREREEREKQRLKEEEEKRKKEAEERERKAKQEEQLAAKATRSGAFDAELRAKRERDLMARPARSARERGERRGGWGKPIAITLFLLIVAGLGIAHVVPIDVTPYQTAASEAFRRPVKIGSANLSLFTGLQLKFNDVTIGDAKFAQVRAHPALEALTGPRKTFTLVELEGVKLDQESVGEALFIKMKGDNFGVGRIVARKLELAGPLTLPKDLEGDLTFDGEGMLRQGFLRGPETLVAKFVPKGQGLEFDMSAASFTVPFAPEISLSQFSAKGTATPQGVSISEWDGQTLNGTLSGTANVRWGNTWAVDGVLTARNINAAVFAPALISDGRAEGSGKFQMRGEPGKLTESSRIDGSFTINRGVLGSIDLSRAIQTQGRFATGRTQFNEMNGQATYDRGAVTLRNITLGAGQLNAGASAEISQSGALSGRIVADVKVAQQQLRATLNLGGTVKDPQVKN